MDEKIWEKKEPVVEPRDMSDVHEHQHGAYGGHKVIHRGNHIDYVHDGHIRRIHGKNIEACEGGEIDDLLVINGQTNPTDSLTRKP